jgi:hypothetical protein
MLLRESMISGPFESGLSSHVEGYLVGGHLRRDLRNIGIRSESTHVVLELRELLYAVSNTSCEARYFVTSYKAGMGRELYVQHPAALLCSF